MLLPELLRELRLPADSHPERRDWLSAASGLVLAGEYLHVVADDEHHLCSFRFNPRHPADRTVLQLTQLLPGTLPQAAKPRKRAKPDLEVLLQLPADSSHRHGRLLCLGSGGKANRRRALTVPMGDNGMALVQHVSSHDLGGFFEPLARHCDDLNIEGAFIHGAMLTLLQRGNKGERAVSACMQFDLDHFTAWLDGRTGLIPALQSLLPLDFGKVLGVPLCPTDGAALPDGGWIATLVAEDTRDSVVDGSCVASALAVMDASNQLIALHRLEGAPKVEGVALLPATTAGKELSVLLVTDPDDAGQASRLLRLTLP